MRVLFASAKVESYCTNVKSATKLFGGDKALAIKLMDRINAIREATVIKDIILMRPFHFHKLANKNGKNYEGLFAIDLKSRTDPWRIVLQPLDDNEEPFVPCNIDEIADKVTIVLISEVSKHYE